MPALFSQSCSSEILNGSTQLATSGSSCSGENAADGVAKSYRLKEKILSVQISSADPRQTTLLYVPAGAVIALREEDRQAGGDLVSVQWESQVVLLFRQDLHRRAEPLPRVGRVAFAARL